MTTRPPSAALARDEGLARIHLLRSPNIGPVTYSQLLRRFGDARAALDALPELAARGLSSGGASRGRMGRGSARYQPVTRAAIEDEVAAVKKLGARYIFHDSPEYPPLLRLVEGAPPILIVRGEAALARRSPVALVGARNASAGASRLAREFAEALSQAGHAVVSGLARGIDAAAHRGALAGQARGGGPGTIAVIAGGIDVVYPPEHAALQEEIAATGLLVTEQPPGLEPLPRHFPARNRIIAALAVGTVVVEAAPRSGSLITARLASDYGREVMAIPGSPLDPRSHGCNDLIREGAVLVQSVADVIELITSFDGVPRSGFREDEADAYDHGPAEVALEQWPAPDDAAQDAVMVAIAALLSTAPVAVDELVRQSGAVAASVQMALIELELAGELVRHAGGRVSRAV